jgi:hypothetical protein
MDAHFTVLCQFGQQWLLTSTLSVDPGYDAVKKKPMEYTSQSWWEMSQQKKDLCIESRKNVAPALLDTAQDSLCHLVGRLWPDLSLNSLRLQRLE